MPREIRQLPDLTPAQVVKLQDALLANADTLLTSALRVLELGNVALARSLAILGMEESGKAIAIHDRRVQMAYTVEGAPFVTPRLSEIWASHQRKLELVYDFLVDERYYFGSGWPNPEEKQAELGAIKRWTTRHDKLKKRGFYVELGKTGEALTPAQAADTESLAAVIEHVHQIGWQIRLGEHIEAKGQAMVAAGRPPMTETDIAEMTKLFGSVDPELVEQMIELSRKGVACKGLANDAYRLKLPDAGSNPFANLGKPGYEAETRELLALAESIGLSADNGAENNSGGE